MADAAEDVVSSSSASSSSSLSPPKSPPHQQQQQNQQLPAKRRAGRKKFRETRHPVYRGVRARAGGSRWVCEVREPQAQARIWLGTYPTPEMAARAHDVAAMALRGGALAADLLNFPDSAHTLPRPRTAAPDDIRCAAAQAAELYRPAAAHHLIIARSSSSTAAPPRPLLALPPPPEPSAACFLDEDAIFDMPGLIDDMARGMLLTPPAMGRGLDWAAVDDDVDCTLWMDD